MHSPDKTSRASIKMNFGNYENNGVYSSSKALSQSWHARVIPHAHLII